MNQYLTAMEAMSSVFDVTASPMQMFNKKSYKSGFEQVYQKLVPAFDAIEALYGSVGEPGDMIANMANAVVDQARKLIEDCPKRSKRDTMMMNLNI